jgi:hypothetical protein
MYEWLRFYLQVWSFNQNARINFKSQWLLINIHEQIIFWQCEMGRMLCIISCEMTKMIAGIARFVIPSLGSEDLLRLPRLLMQEQCNDYMRINSELINTAYNNSDFRRKVVTDDEIWCTVCDLHCKWQVLHTKSPLSLRAQSYGRIAWKGRWF